MEVRRKDGEDNEQRKSVGGKNLKRKIQQGSGLMGDVRKERVRQDIKTRTEKEGGKKDGRRRRYKKEDKNERKGMSG